MIRDLRQILLTDKLQEHKMGWACGTNGKKRNALLVLIGKPEGQRALGRPEPRRKDNTKVHLTETGWERWGGFTWLGVGRGGELLPTRY